LGRRRAAPALVVEVLLRPAVAHDRDHLERVPGGVVVVPHALDAEELRAGADLVADADDGRLAALQIRDRGEREARPVRDDARDELEPQVGLDRRGARVLAVLRPRRPLLGGVLGRDAGRVLADEVIEPRLVDLRGHGRPDRRRGPEVQVDGGARADERTHERVDRLGREPRRGEDEREARGPGVLAEEEVEHGGGARAGVSNRRATAPVGAAR
jgi:hypothetical protein